MKIIKTILLFYNSILIFSLVTVGLITQSYDDLTPTLLLIPVGVYFTLSLTKKIAKSTHLTNSFSFIHLRRILRLYSLAITSLLIFANLAASASLMQSSLTIILLPLLISFVLELFSKKSINQFKIKKVITLTKLSHATDTTEKSQPTKQPLKKEKEIGGDNVNDKEVVDYLSEVNQASDTEAIEPELVSNLVLNEPVETITEAEEMPSDEFDNIFDAQDQKRRQFLKIIGGGGMSLFLMLFVFKDKASAAFFGSTPGPGIVGIKDSDGEKIDPAVKQPTDGYNISEIDDASSPAYYGFVHKDGGWYIAKEDSSGAYRYVSGSSNFSTGWTGRSGLSYDYFDNIF